MKIADGYIAYWNLKEGHALYLPTGEKEWVKILGIPLFKSEKWAMHKVLDVKNKFGAVVQVHVQNVENGRQTILHRDGNTKVTAYLCEYNEPIKEGI